jgi:hypothetical protein
MKKILAILPIFICQLAFGQIPSYLPTNGLAAYYPFNGNVNDESGNGNHGTNYNATLTTDKNSVSNKAYYFGGNARIQIPTTSPTLTTKIITINAWVSYGNNSTTMIVTRRKWSDATAEQYSFDTKAFYVKRNGACVPNAGWSQLNYTNTPSLNNWAMMTVTYDGSNMKYYLNGVLNSSNPLGSNVFMDSCVGADLTIGGTWNDFPFYYTGKIDDVSIHNRVLTAQEILAMYGQCSKMVLNQPTHLTEVEGNEAIYSTSSSNSNATFRWQQNTGVNFTNLSNGGIYSGVTSNILKISNVPLSLSNTYYRCILTTPQGCKDTTNPARLTVNPIIYDSIPFWLPDSSLVAWYPFNGNAKDESGNNNHGVVYGATLTQDRFNNLNKSYTFNGTSSRIFIPYSSSLNTPLLSINLWVRTANTATTQIFTKRNWADASSEQYSVDTKDFYIKRNSNCIADQGWQKVGYTPSPMQNVWTLISMTYDGRYIRYYYNGILRNTNDLLTYKEMDTCLGANLSIGAGWANFPFYFKGEIDDISIYGRALTAKEIYQIFTQCKKVVKDQPVNFNAVSGGNAFFKTSTIVNDSSSTFQWEENSGAGFAPITSNSMYSGVNSPQLNIANVTKTMDKYTYRCKIDPIVTCLDTTVSAVLNVQSVGLIENARNFELKLYPNPASFEFAISIDGQVKNSTLIGVYDSYGRNVTNNLQVNISSLNQYEFKGKLSEGIYWIKLEINGQTISRSLAISY